MAGVPSFLFFLSHFPPQHPGTVFLFPFLSNVLFAHARAREQFTQHTPSTKWNGHLAGPVVVVVVVVVAPGAHTQTHTTTTTNNNTNTTTTNNKKLLGWPARN